MVKERVFNLSGHGHVDMAACDACFAKELEDFSLPDETLQKTIAALPQV